MTKSYKCPHCDREYTKEQWIWAEGFNTSLIAGCTCPGCGEEVDPEELGTVY